jgi:hypothetical protein
MCYVIMLTPSALFAVTEITDRCQLLVSVCVQHGHMQLVSVSECMVRPVAAIVVLCV